MVLQRVLFVLCSVVSVGFAATVANVQADITNFTNNMTAFTTSLASFDPNDLLFSGIDLLITGESVIQALNESIADAQALNHPVKNPGNLISSFSVLSTAIPSMLDAIGTTQPQFAVVPIAGPVVVGAVGGIVVSLQRLFQNFSQAVVASLPANQQLSLNNVLDTINESFTSLIEAYSVNICSN